MKKLTVNQKKQIRKSIKNIKETKFMKDHLKEDVVWLDTLKKNYDKMDKEKRLDYLMRRI